MNPRFADKTAKVVVVDSSGAVRQLLTEVFRQQGYQNVQGVGTMKDALGIFEVEVVDWLIAPLGADQPINAMQILRLITEDASLRDARVSLIVDENEFDFLPYAYEMGLLCHFEKPFNKETITAAVTELVATFTRYQWDHTKTAAFYLRAHLQSRKLWDGQVALEKSLLNLYPGEVEFLFEIARPLHHLGLDDQAKASLLQAHVLDPKSGDKVEALGKELFGQDGLKEAMAKATAAGTNVNVLGIKNCVIIDSDEASRRGVAAAVKSLGVAEIHEFEDGAAAWDWFTKNGDPSLVMQEWRIPKMTGPALVQRLRKKSPCLPIIAVSSLIGNDDIALVKEMGIASVVEKPIDSGKLTKSIIHVVQQDKMPTEAETLENKIRHLLEANNYADAIRLNEKYMGLSNIPEVRKKKIMAEFAYVERKYTLARDLTVEAIKGQADSITMLNFLGKCLMKLRDFQAALKCFEKAQNLSPMNIERLCAIAEVNSELGDHAAAEAAVAKADKIDKEREDVVETGASIKIAQGKTSEAKALMGKLQSMSNLISLMNNKAVAYARNGNFSEGIAMYEKTLASIPEDKKPVLAIVGYNLALAYARQNMLEESKATLEKALGQGPSKVRTKCQSLLDRVTKAIKSHRPLEFIEDTGKKEEASEETPKEEGDDLAAQTRKTILATIGTNPGDICCFRVYVNPQKPVEKVLKLVATVPHFVRRETIERSAADGLEKTMKSA